MQRSQMEQAGQIIGAAREKFNKVVQTLQQEGRTQGFANGKLRLLGYHDQELQMIDQNNELVGLPPCVLDLEAARVIHDGGEAVEIDTADLEQADDTFYGASYELSYGRPPRIVCGYNDGVILIRPTEQGWQTENIGWPEEWAEDDEQDSAEDQDGTH